MAAIQDTPRCILVKDDSKVQSLEDLAGMRLQANAGRPFVDFLKKGGYLENVEVVPYGGTIANFVNDENTAIQAYSFSEPLLAKQQGVETRQLMVSSAGFNPYTSCLMTTDALIAEQRELVHKMTQACCEGWQAYLKAPEKTNSLIASVNEHGMTLEALEFGAHDLAKLCKPDGVSEQEIGLMTEERWSTLVDQFKDLGLLDEAFSASSVFTLDFLKPIE